MTKPKLEPLKSQVMTGYNLSAARASFLDYISHAESCLALAIRETNEALGKEAVQNVDVGFLRRDINLAKAAVEQIEESHRILSRRYQKLGFRKLETEKDFKDLGVTTR